MVTPAARLFRPRSELPTPGEALLPWGVVLVGIGYLVGLAVTALLLPLGRPSGPTPSGLDLALPPPAESAPAASAPEVAGGSDPTGRAPEDAGLPGSAIRGMAGHYSPTPPPESPPPTETKPPSPPPDPHFAGTYQIEESYWDVFIAGVVIVNRSSADRDWRVELTFGSDVGRLNTFWVDGTSQPALQRSGDRYVFTSTVPVPAGTRVVLKVHFDRFGWDVYPDTCTVSGVDCDIARDHNGY